MGIFLQNCNKFLICYSILMDKESKYLISGEEISSKLINTSKYNKGVCFVFGAGASYGYVDDFRFKPPTVKTLLEPDQNRIVQEVLEQPEHLYVKKNRNLFLSGLKRNDGDLEEYLSSLYKTDPNDKLFSQFLIYLYDIFYKTSENFSYIDSDTNCYKKLLYRMINLKRSQPWSCLSFNYDTLLEQSYLDINRDPNRKDFSSLQEYSNFNPRIIKMHGSINFRYVLVQPYQSGDEDNYSNYDFPSFTKLMEDVGALPVVFPVIPNNAPVARFKKLYKYNTETRQQDFYSELSFPFILIPTHEETEFKNSFFKI